MVGEWLHVRVGLDVEANQVAETERAIVPAPFGNRKREASPRTHRRAAGLTCETSHVIRLISSSLGLTVPIGRPPRRSAFATPPDDLADAS